MKIFKILGIILILSGVLSFVYGSFAVTRETHETQIGPIELTVKEKENVKVPTWAGITFIVVGSIFLLLKSRC